MKPEDLFAKLEESSPEFKKAWALEEPRMRRTSTACGPSATQQDLARRAGMRQPRIAELERGDTGSTQDTLVRIATALSVDIAELYQRVEKPAPRRRQAHAR